MMKLPMLNKIKKITKENQELKKEQENLMTIQKKELLNKNKLVVILKNMIEKDNHKKESQLIHIHKIDIVEMVWERVIKKEDPVKEIGVTTKMNLKNNQKLMKKVKNLLNKLKIIVSLMKNIWLEMPDKFLNKKQHKKKNHLISQLSQKKDANC
jgi:hypothetical protein